MDIYIYGCQPKNMGVSPQIIHFNRVFQYFHHAFWGCPPYFWKHPYMMCPCFNVSPCGAFFVQANPETLRAKFRNSGQGHLMF